LFEDLLPELVRSISDVAGAIPVIFKGIERQYAKGSTPQSPNVHDFHELIYVRSGKAEMLIDDKCVSVVKGDNIIIRPGICHTVRVETGSVDMLVLYFGLESDLKYHEDPKQMESVDVVNKVNYTTLESFLKFASGKTADESKSRNPETFETSSYLLIGNRGSKALAAIAERIIEESSGHRYSKELMMQFLAMELMIALSRALRDEWEESLRVKTAKTKELVAIAQEYIIQNHEKNISLSDIAGHVFLSQGYFTRAFKDITGISPINFLIQVRIEHACRLLEDEKIKVSGIIKAVGFSNSQRFNEAFRKHTGSTPGEYRKRILNDR
jgi:AraC-like DNA-binding protein